MELFPAAHIGFLKNLETTLPPKLRDRHVTVYGSRLQNKNLEDFDALTQTQALIPWQDYDLVVINTAGYLKHLRRERTTDTRIIVYQHDLLPFLWRTDTENQTAAEASELMSAQEMDLEFSGGIDLTIAANYALRNSLAAMTRRDVPLAYPLIDQTIFYPDAEAEAEYFVALDSPHLDTLVHLMACVTDKLVVLGPARPDKFLRELKPDNIFYTGNISVSDQAYYIAGARALICGETKALSHLPLAALKSGIPLISHPSQGMTEFLSDGESGIELTTASADEILAAVRNFRGAKPARERIASSVDWLGQEYFLRRMRKALDKEV